MKNTSIDRQIRKLIGVVILAVALAEPAHAANLEPPQSVGKLQLAHALRGEEALQAINRLHGKGLASTDAYVAHYEKNGMVAMVYVSRVAQSSQTGVQIDRMVAGIRTGKTPFSGLKATERNGTTVYSAAGQGQIHTFYRRGKEVVWIAADPPVATEVTDVFLRRDP